MKSKEFIEKLQEIDPLGDCEVCVGGCITELIRLPWYYDGKAHILMYDDKGGIVGMRQATVEDGDKIVVYTKSVDDLGYDEEWDNYTREDHMPEIKYTITGDEYFVKRYEDAKELARKHLSEFKQKINND